MTPYLRHSPTAYVLYRLGLPVSSGKWIGGVMYSESYYEVGVGELLDWEIADGWADGGSVKIRSLLNDKEMHFALCGVVDISDHFIPTPAYKSQV